MTAGLAELDRMPRRPQGILYLLCGHFALGTSAGVAARCWPA